MIAILIVFIGAGVALYFASKADKKAQTISYYTSDTNRLAPYPNMTEEDLQDFESFEREMRNK